MKLREFFLGKGKIASAVESLSATPAEELKLDLSLLHGYQERVLRESLETKNPSRKAMGGDDISFQAYVKVLLQAKLALLDLDFEVKEGHNLLYLETPRRRMIFLQSDLLRDFLQKERHGEAPDNRGYTILDKPLELLYAGSRNYLIVVRSTHPWGIRAYTTEGYRSFTWDKIQGVNYSLLLRNLPFESTYVLRENLTSFEIRWSLEKY